MYVYLNLYTKIVIVKYLHLQDKPPMYVSPLNMQSKTFIAHNKYFKIRFKTSNSFLYSDDLVMTLEHV